MSRRRRLVFLIIVSVLAILLVASILLPMLNAARHGGGRTPNGDRMQSLGTALLLYAQDHGGRYPPTLDALVSAEGLNPEMVLCTGDGEVDPPPRYLYLGKDFTSDTADFTTVVAYTPLAWAGGRGADVLFGDGHLDWITAADLPVILARGGPTTRSTTAPIR